MILHKYVDDLSDADLRLRPVEGMHPIALQLGHLILAEQMFINMIKPGSAPALPDGFEEAHDYKNKELTDSGFVSKDKYLELLAANRAATKPFSTPFPNRIWMILATARCPPSPRRSGPLYSWRACTR